MYINVFQKEPKVKCTNTHGQKHFRAFVMRWIETEDRKDDEFIFERAKGKETLCSKNGGEVLNQLRSLLYTCRCSLLCIGRTKNTENNSLFQFRL